MSKKCKENKEGKEIKERQHKLYAVDYYNKKKDYIDNNYKEYSVLKLVKELEKDNSYHMRILDTETYILYGDCDGFKGTFDQFAELLIKFLKLRYSIDISKIDISYTSNDSKPGSFHYSVPKLHASSVKLKEIHTEFFNQHKDIFTYVVDGKTTKVVDTSVYTNHWFRYPNQSKSGDANAKHIVKHGNLIDFIVEHIPKDSICINDKKLIVMRNDTKKNNQVKTKSSKRQTIDALTFDSDEDESNTLGKRNEVKNKLLNNSSENTSKYSSDESGDDTLDESSDYTIDESSDDNMSDNSDNDIMDCDNSDDDENKKSQKNNQKTTKLKSLKITVKKPNKRSGSKRAAGPNTKIVKTTEKNKTPKSETKSIAKQIKKKGEGKFDNNKKISNYCEDDIPPDFFDNNLFEFSDDEIADLLELLSDERCENYNDWLNVGFSLYNINDSYLFLWENWSKKSQKYEKGVCKRKWKSFLDKNDDKKLTLRSLMYWCNLDNAEKYKSFLKEIKTKNIINTKFPDVELDLGKTHIVTKDTTYTALNNDKCFIYGKDHGSPSMYIERTNNRMIIKCTHRKCFGKTYPCEHVQLSNSEMNLIMNVTINNNYGSSESNELMKFPNFDIFEDEFINELIFNSLNGGHATMADIIYYYFKNDYMYAEDKNWYVFENHKWNFLGFKNENLSLTSEKKLKAIYMELIKFAEKNHVDEKIINELKKMRKNFEAAHTKRDIMSVVEERYSALNNPKKNFLKFLDSNRNLLVFNNGVYDLETHTFRDGKPTDYMSMSVGYDYQNSFSQNSVDLLTFLSDIQPDEAERDFLLTYLSHALYGNMLEWFTILTGNGRNGKSKFIELIKKVFGDLYSPIKSQMLTRPQPDAQAPDPGLLSLRHKKIVISSEPEKRFPLNSGFIKFITGRDSVQLRECHGNQMIDFDPKFILLFVCNDIPDTDDFDSAFSKRVKCINFPTEFCDNPSTESQKLIDTTINEKFDSWRSDFMLLLIAYYKKYMTTKKIIITENVNKWTNQYKANTDIYLEFLNANIVEDTGKDSRLHCSIMYDKFKIWFKDNNPGVTNIPSNKAFCNNLRKHKIVKDIRIGNKSQIGIENVKFKNDIIKDETLKKDNVKVVKIINK